MKKILIVEDENALSNALSEKLEKEGFGVETAKNGVEGLTAIKKNSPDFIVLDLLMPVMSGLEMLNELKKDTEKSKIPVLVLTNLSDDETMADALQDGSLDYLVKSDWSLESIVEKIKNRLK